MLIPEDLQKQINLIRQVKIASIARNKLDEYKTRLDTVYQAVEALEPDENDEEEFLEWEELLETLDDCYDDYYEVME